LRLAFRIETVEVLVGATSDTPHDGRRGAAQHGVQCAPAPICLDRIKLDLSAILFADDAHAISVGPFLRPGKQGPDFCPQVLPLHFLRVLRGKAFLI
jgi:hypothetical protein